MSRTDKTDPYWVKANRYGTEWHNHARGVCDFSDYDGPRWWTRRYSVCCLIIETGYFDERYNNLHGLHRGAKFDRRLREKSERQRVRRELMRGDEDIAPTRHRHSVAWDW